MNTARNIFGPVSTPANVEPTEIYASNPSPVPQDEIDRQMQSLAANDITVPFDQANRYTPTGKLTGQWHATEVHGTIQKDPETFTREFNDVRNIPERVAFVDMLLKTPGQEDAGALMRDSLVDEFRAKGLIKQLARAFAECGIEHEIIKPNKPETTIDEAYHGTTAPAVYTPGF